ncbi:MAG: DUF3427 domain-containing protein, partial [Rhodoglobus sp.]
LSAPFALAYRSSAAFRRNLDDVVNTGLALIADRYRPDRPFTPGRQYSRKDASRLLDWTSNMYSTIYGYRVDSTTMTCPIFVTLHKSSDVSASTAYEDELLDALTLRWYTRSRRTLQSGEVKSIVNNQVALHVFAKKDDAEGSDYYYLGEATSAEAEQASMLDGAGGELPVVRMLLRFEDPIPTALFDYFHTALTLQ